MVKTMSDILPVSHYIYNDTYYNYDQLQEVLNIVRKNFRFVRKQKIRYFNVPCSLDIETSSFYDNGEKRSCMYCWSFCIYGVCMFGRTWEQLIYLYKEIIRILDLNYNKRLIIYIQNLGFEFQFLRCQIQFDKIFAIGNRVPVYAVTPYGVEFRCSYILSGYKLETIAKNLINYKLKKLIGNLDYSKIRHTNTPMNENEILYSLYDVKIVVAYIAEKIENGENINRIPLTKTGYVREYVRNKCFYENGIIEKNSRKRQNYKNFINSLIIKDLQEYQLFRRAFAGGFTHANPFRVGKSIGIKDFCSVSGLVASLDLTSSYPSHMIGFKYPMSSGRHIELQGIEDFNNRIKTYCCIFDITFYNIRPRVFFDNYISESKCFDKINVFSLNGRLVNADKITVTITEVDYEIIQKYYEWNNISVGEFVEFDKWYLPKDIIISILDLYEKKTKLKGVAGQEVEYLNSKEMINSIYGMIACHADIVPENYNYDVFNNEWLEPEIIDIEKNIDKYNKNPKRFTFYPWAVYVTAYARRTLLNAIYNIGNDYIYSDTDSVKILNYEKHKNYFENYNNYITIQIEKCLDFYNIDKNKLKPKTIKGIEKPLGVWDFEGYYTCFKTLGAKRYLYEDTDGNAHITVAGIGKTAGINYLQNNYKNIFNAFTPDLCIPAGDTGKMTHTYLDFPFDGKVIDYLGNENEYHEKSALHLENAAYDFSKAQKFIDLVFSIYGQDF